MNINKPRVLNIKKDEIDSEAVYIGRPSIFGNMFTIGKDGSRNDVIEKHKRLVLSNGELLRQIKLQLKGKNLVCYCAPLACHGDFLLEVANEKESISDNSDIQF